MTGDEFKRRLADHGLTQAQAADKLGVGLRTVARWATGETPVPLWVDRLLGCWDRMIEVGLAP